MIKTDRQLAQARVEMDALQASLQEQAKAGAPKGISPSMYAAALAAKEQLAQDLRRDIEAYEALKSGDPRAISADGLAALPIALIQTRILRRMTQKQLAEKLGVKEQQVQRWEQREYENVNYASLLDVADALEFDVSLVIRKKGQGRAITLTRPVKRAVAPHSYGGVSSVPEWPQQSGIDPARLLQVLQKASTFNNTCVIQYSFIGSEKHKKLRVARDELKSKGELFEYFKELYTYLKQGFELSVSHNASFLRSTFAGRDAALPRICLKSNMIGSGGDQEILPLFRDARVGYDSSAKVEDNTGFAHIAKTGGYYVQNDIPAAALRGDYINPRLDVAAIQRDFGAKNKDLTALYDNWPDYWKKATGGEDPSAFYKSTLIMPLKLWDAQVSADFREFLMELGIDTKIFGYLCLDHTEVDYFNPAVDLNMAKIAADALCTMLLLRMKWTTRSSNTRAVSKIPAVARWLETQNRSAPTLQARPIVFESELPAVESEGEPTLVPADLTRSLARAD